jgi:signal transduction histidine kinase
VGDTRQIPPIGLRRHRFCQHGIDGVEDSVLDDRHASMNIEAKAGRHVIISVTDSGTGIPENILDKIVAPFFTTKELNKGTGLGRSTVMTIVKNHGGLFGFTQNLARETLSKCICPQWKFVPNPEAKGRAWLIFRGENGQAVLVVDDEVSILSITGQTLRTFG